MNRKFLVSSVIAAMIFAAGVVSCEKDAEKLLEIVKNENDERKVEYDEQNRIAKMVWYDKNNEVFKKYSFTYSDEFIRVKIEEISYEEYLMTGKYTKLDNIDNKIILSGVKKVYLDF